MDLTMWYYADESHPVYSRPRDADRWAFVLPGMQAAPYEEAEEGVELDTGHVYPTGEPLQLTMPAMPALEWHQTAAGNTVLTMRLHSDWAAEIEMADVLEAARAMWEDFRRHSRGPLTYQDLADLGHPYGYGTPRQALTWEKLGRPRKVPRYYAGRSLGHPRGIRGSVPTMSVVNYHTGEFEAAWRWSYSWRGDGLTLVFWNERKSEAGAPVAWFLAHGTVWMQAHGPWEVVPRRHWSPIVNAWRQAAQRAALRARARVGQFGTEES
ncbi:MAG: hypothetical protein AB7Y46_16795 [Armatimonadota bacterium]